MDTIKSAKAYNHIYERFCCKTDEVCGLEYWDGFTEISHSELLQMLDELRGVAVVATKLAEQEAEERHRHETRWRSVEEELPETNNFGNGISAEVLCYVPDVHKVLRYSKNKFYPNGAWFNLSEELQQYPTHWKPIE